MTIKVSTFTFLFLFISLCNFKAVCQNNIPVSTNKELRTAVQTLLSAQKGTFAVAFKDIGSGDTLYINARENFHAASTMKTPVMIALYRQATLGRFSMTDSVQLKNDFISIADSSHFTLDSADDSEQSLYLALGRKITIASLVRYMITMSSNLATNILIEMVGTTAIMNDMKACGANDIRILRGVEDGKAYAKGLNNTVTAYDLALIYEALAKGKCAPAKETNEMLQILEAQHFNDIIPAKLPHDVRVAHKTGFITGVHHDSGIIFLPDGRKYVLVLLSKELINEPAAIDAMAEVSLLIYKYMMARQR